MKLTKSNLQISTGKKILFSIITLLFCLIITLCLGEALVRLTVPKEMFWPVSNIYHISATPGVIYTYRPNYNGIAFGVDLKTNSMGFRGPEWIKKKDHTTFRIALLGDSHAFGYGVPYKSTVGESLALILKERYRQPVEVLNFGVSAYNTMQQKAVLEQFALGYNPDMVIIMPSGNDHWNSPKVDSEGWLHSDGEILNTNIEKDRTVAHFNVEFAPPSYLFTKSRFLLFLRLIYKKRQLEVNVQKERDYIGEKKPSVHWMDHQVSSGPVSDRLFEAVYQPLVIMLTELDKRNIPVVLAPFASQNDYRTMFQTIKREFNVPIVELLSLFPEARSWKELQKKFNLKWDNHLNAAAHLRFAEGIAEAIISTGYHPSNLDHK